MAADHSRENITRATFDTVLARYDEIIRLASESRKSEQPDRDESMQELDQWRFNTLPELLHERAKENDVAWLETTEVERLIRWMIFVLRMHSRFHPPLLRLVKSNHPTQTRGITSDAFSTYDNRTSTNQDGGGPPLATFDNLSCLSGIDFVSASLLLSVYDPVGVPFFSREGFRWAMFEEGRWKGWDRKIKYTVEEYWDYWVKVQVLRRRLGGGEDDQVRAADVERVAYVLGKERVLALSSLNPSILGAKRSQAEADIQDGGGDPPVKRKT
ncbi:MAG: hypothetical protein M1816_001664 [Peltula sp. TS41687]|nr:MAG: hypothetical protein M1816_001664 [Peltula sp. TS41687]